MSNATAFPTANPSAVPQNREAIKTAITGQMEKIVPRREGFSWSSVQFKPIAEFDGQNPDERIYVIARRHWIRNIGWIFSNSFYALIPIGFAVVFDLFSPKIPALNFRIYIIIILAYYSFIFTNVFKSFIDWYFDTYVVTNERVLDFNLKTFSSYSVDEIPLENIDSVKQNTPGITAGLFNYGNIDISTESKEGVVHFFSIPQPTKVRDIISDLARIARTFRSGN